MIVLLGVVCIMSRLNCSAVSPWGTFPNSEKCEEVRHKYDELIRPIEWLDGKFECAEEEDVT